MVIHKTLPWISLPNTHKTAPCQVPSDAGWQSSPTHLEGKDIRNSQLFHHGVEKWFHGWVGLLSERRSVTIYPEKLSFKFKLWACSFVFKAWIVWLLRLTGFWKNQHTPKCKGSNNCILLFSNLADLQLKNPTFPLLSIWNTFNSCVNFVIILFYNSIFLFVCTTLNSFHYLPSSVKYFLSFPWFSAIILTVKALCKLFFKVLHKYSNYNFLSCFLFDAPCFFGCKIQRPPEGLSNLVVRSLCDDLTVSVSFSKIFWIPCVILRTQCFETFMGKFKDFNNIWISLRLKICRHVLWTTRTVTLISVSIRKV